jgi:hypothetical protein
MVSEIANKPKSRFVEHFDAMPPAELLDIIADGMEHEAPLKINTKQSISLFTRPSNNIIGMKSAEILPTSSIDQAAVTPVVSRSASTSAKSNKQSKIKPKPTRSTSAHRLTNRSKSDPVIAIVNDTIESKLEQIISDDASSSSKENQDEQYTKPSNIKSVFNTHSLNRADVIIKRYDSWNEFIQRIYFWFSEMIRHSQIAERSYNHLLKDKLGHKSKNTTITSLQSVFARATTEFSNEELKFKETLQGFLTVLEKMKKETTTQMKGLKSRTDLDREEFLKRAEVTVSFMSQLDKACKEARRTIDKGGQVTTDPWLCNLCKCLLHILVVSYIYVILRICLHVLIQ